jgi:hypothetical protein
MRLRQLPYKIYCQCCTLYCSCVHGYITWCSCGQMSGVDREHRTLGFPFSVFSRSSCIPISVCVCVCVYVCACACPCVCICVWTTGRKCVQWKDYSAESEDWSQSHRGELPQLYMCMSWCVFVHVGVCVCVHVWVCVCLHVCMWGCVCVHVWVCVCVCAA